MILSKIRRNKSLNISIYLKISNERPEIWKNLKKLFQDALNFKNQLVAVIIE